MFRKKISTGDEICFVMLPQLIILFRILFTEVKLTLTLKT